MGEDLPHVQDGSAHNLNAHLIGQGWPLGRPDVFFWENVTKTCVKPRVCACRTRAPQKGLGRRLGLGLGLGWFGPTFKVDIDDTRPA